MAPAPIRITAEDVIKWTQGSLADIDMESFVSVPQIGTNSDASRKSLYNLMTSTSDVKGYAGGNCLHGGNVIKTLVILLVVTNVRFAPREVVAQASTDIPVSQRGAALYHSCLAAVRAMDAADGGTNADNELAVHCADYIRGFLDAALFTHTLCVGNATNETVVRTYVDFIQKRPKLMDD